MSASIRSLVFCKVSALAARLRVAAENGAAAACKS
jgi:hypothetical protein